MMYALEAPVTVVENLDTGAVLILLRSVVALAYKRAAEAFVAGMDAEEPAK